DASPPSNNLDAATRDAAIDGSAPDAANPPSDAQIGTLDAGDAGGSSARSFVYVGGWDWSGSVYPFRGYALDHASGAFTSLGATLDFGANPSSISHNVAGDRLYVTNEYGGDKGGVTVASVDLASGAATKLDSASGAGAFVYSTVHPNGKYLFAADYNEGEIAVFRIENDGKLGDETDRVKFPKAGDDSAQSHSVGVHHDGKWVYVPNKALDTIAQFTFDEQTGALDRRDDIESEGGPRHIALSGEYAFVMHEGSSVLRSFAVESDGDLRELDDASALPSDFEGESRGAHVLVHPNGRYAYASNRGQNSIALFDIGTGGELTLRANTPSGGDDPWDFAIDADGKLLVLVNTGDQEGTTGSLNLFKIADDGVLSAFGTPVGNLKVPTGVTLVRAR
ncbi:MAG TPA: beta-propeller fold lactonase family protein, partial [Polyangiales bacterium]|nr:beta-propeller fold lactonase family protein [Polyangiales bacterium]